jgi:phosphoribosylamine--glycine ligase
MKFLMYSQSGEGAHVAYRIQEEGNTVGIFIKDKVYASGFDGLLDKVNPESFIDKNTIVIFDISGNGNVADSYRRKGIYVFGASSFADQLENDRNFGFEMMKKCGIKVPEYKEFTDYKLAKQYIESSEARLVFKPNGSMPCKLTYCSCNGDELIAYLTFIEKRFSKEIDSFILQEFIEGVVVSSEFFCDGEKFISPANHTVEVKKIMNDDLGPSTGCSGNTTWPCSDDRIIKEGIKKAEQLCKQHNFVGNIDLNAVVNSDGVYGLEWTPRFGYDATPALLSIFNQDIGKFFSDMCRKQCKEIPIEELYASSVRITIPPYPIETESPTEELSPNIGIPIQKYDADNCYFFEVMAEDDQLVHSGGTGVICCAIGEAEDCEKSFERPYKICGEIIIPDKQYRTDLKKVLPEMVEEVANYA